MRSLALFLGIFLSTNSFAANPLQKYLGCYQLVSSNGVLQKQGDAAILNGSGTVLEYASDPQTHDQIAATNIIVEAINPAIDPIVLWPSTTSAFNDRGTYSSDRNGDHYRFDGVLEEEELMKVHSAIDISPQSDQTLLVSFSWNEISQDGKHSYSSNPTTALLKLRPDWYDSSTGRCLFR